MSVCLGFYDDFNAFLLNNGILDLVKNFFSQAVLDAELVITCFRLSVTANLKGVAIHNVKTKYLFFYFPMKIE